LAYGMTRRNDRMLIVELMCSDNLLNDIHDIE